MGVTVHDDTPASQLIAEAATPIIITDARGRRIKLTKPSVLEQFRLVKLLGGEAASNMPYMSMVAPLCYISEIDGDPVYFPKSENEIEALIQRLDEAGVVAVQKGVQEHFGEADAEAIKDEAKGS